MPPRITVCIPNLNKMPFLRQCIESLLAQTSNEWQCVFVDGYSTDGSWEYMQNYRLDKRFKLLQGLRQGMYEDWNECLRGVDTEYFYILTSDDLCFPELLSTVVAALDSQPSIDMCHFPFLLIDKDGATLKSYEEFYEQFANLYIGHHNRAHIRSGWCELMMHFAFLVPYLCINSTIYRSTILTKVGGFKSCYRTAGDIDWTMRCVAHTDVLFIPDTLTAFRRYAEQATSAESPTILSSMIFAVLRDNLKLLSAEGRKPVDRRELLTRISERYLLCLLKDLNTAVHCREIGKVGALVQEMIEPLKFLSPHALRRMAKSQAETNKLKTAFAKELIEKYELDWPPRSI